ncbi:MAG TPA: organic hydroperoxide resistance protein [Chloroflexia bacterium]|nr:organic hydroperoxide resistance protein [Chloroflexia bacterium]
MEETPSTFKLLYETAATATGGRVGRSVTADGKLALDMSRPKVLGGDDGPGTNPEQLFALGFASCFHNSVQYVARQRQLDITGSQITARVGLGRVAPGAVGLAVTLRGRFPTLSEEIAQALMEAAHQACPYSQATRGNIPVTLEVEPS